SLRGARRRLAELPRVDVERVERWRELRDEIDRLVEEIEEKEARLEARRSELHDREEALRAARRTAERLEARRSSVEEAELEARSLRVRDRRQELGDRRTLETWSYRVSGAVMVLAVGAIFFTPSDALRELVLPLLLVLAVAGPVFYWARGRRKRRDELEREAGTLLDEAREAGLEVDAVSEISGAVRSLDREASRAESDRRGAAERVKAVRERVEEEASALQESRRREREREGALEDLRDELDFDAPEEALAEAGKRSEAEESRRRLEASLTSLAGPDESRWQVEPPDADDLPAWDADAKERVDRLLERTRADYRELRDDFVAAGLQAPEDVLMELQSCRDRIRDLEATWEAGKLAGDVFATMDEALETRLADALARDGDGSVGSVVEAVTERYRTVRRDGDGGLTVLDGSGRAFALASLSRGTRDQVYLALRLGLATSALEAAGVEGGGFFLLDDAFLTADWERRGRLVSAMETLSTDGWQVIYLTCDDHLRNLFIDAGARLHEL
ncbi:MAG: ATP-binding protein, partial [Gemmatimonadota bacterium]